jgi:hypothetical protein
MDLPQVRLTGQTPIVGRDNWDVWRTVAVVPDVNHANSGAGWPSAFSMDCKPRPMMRIIAVASLR